MGEDYSVLLFYHFTPLTDQAREVDWHRALCERLHLCGRLRVSPQGLNGTLSGSTAALGEYTRSVDARLARPSRDTPCVRTPAHKNI